MKKVGHMLGLATDEPEVDLAQVMDILTEHEGDAEEGLSNSRALLQTYDSVGWVQRSGIVTSVDEKGFAYVDHKHNLVLANCPPELRKGSHVTYVGYRQSADEDWTITKVLFVENELWHDEDEEKTVNTESATPDVNKELDTMLKNLVGRVHERKGREVTVEPDMVTFNLDSVSTDFIPIVGDWVEMEAVVHAEVDDLEMAKVGTSIVLKVNRVSPLRSKVCVGRVTHWDQKICFGTIRSEIFFGKDTLDFGYIPSVGDQVVVDAIESNQCGFVWRALKVVAIQRSKLPFGQNQATEDELNALLADKESVIISRDCSFGTMKIGDEKSIAIRVMNSGDKDHWITKSEFRSPSQINLMSPQNHNNLHLPPGKSLMFRFKARASFIGRSSSLFVWTFESFKIGRNLEVNIKSDIMDSCMQDDEEVTIALGWNNYIKKTVGQDMLDSILGSYNKGAVLPGVRPVKNPSFMPVRLGNFGLPRKLLNIFINEGDINFGHGENRLALSHLKEEYPCLNEALNPTSYSERLHTLLFLEELENIYRLNQFNIERGFFRHAGKFLSLCVEGLAEKRPSLIVGDRVIATPYCNNDKRGSKTYNEGYIHKVQHNEILIQFNEQFHQTFSGEYKIKFEMSRGNFVKCHQAVRLVRDCLKADWLFPTCVNYKPAQIHVTEESYYHFQNNEIMSVNEEASSDGNHEVKNVGVQGSENNELTSDTIDNDKEHCMNIPQDLQNGNVNSRLNNDTNMEKIVNDLNKTCIEKEECLSISSSQLIPFSDENCNTKKVKKRLEDQSINFKKVEPNDSAICIVTEEGEEIKKVNQSLYNRDNVIADSTNKNCATDSDTVNEKVQLVFDHLKNTLSENILCEKNVEENIEPLEKTKTVEEVERFSSCIADNKVRRKSSADKTSTTSPLDKGLNQSNMSGRMKAEHNSRRCVEEVERFSYGENSKVRKSVSGRTSTASSSDNDRNQNNMVARRDRMETKQNNRSVEDAKRWSHDKNNRVRKSFSDNVSTTCSCDNNMSQRNMINRGGRRSSTRNSTAGHNKRSKMRFWFDEESEDDAVVYETQKRKIQWFNSSLNHYQKEAVRNVLKGEARPLPYVIFGPPGTGKTITLVETILQIYHLLPDSRLLIATPSNSSSDLISERLLSSNLLIPGTLTRLVGFNYMQEGRLPVSLLPYCAVASMSEVEHNNAQNMIIGRNRITVGTCNTLGILYNAGFPKGHFTHVIIDEAGQGTEPELLIPLSFINAKHGQSVLAGDPNQLGPVILSHYAKELGLGESFLVRLLHTSPYQKDSAGFPETHGYNPHLVTLLINNYRSLPEILKLPSSLFYNDLLVPQVNDKDSKEATVLKRVCTAICLPITRRDGRPPSAILFHGMHGQDLQTEESPSWFNPTEIAQAVMYLQGLYDGGLTPDECGILTPYNKQAAKIRQTIDLVGMVAPKVGSVEEFQGQERMAIIMSAVRCSRQYVSQDIRNNMGFVACPRRLNVALTRARALLIIIGDPHLLVTDVYWKSVLEYCVKNDAYRGCDLPYSLCDDD